MDKEYLKIKLQNLMNLRNIYAAVVMALTGYIFSLLPDFKIFNVIVICFSTIIDFFFMKLFYNSMIAINKILKIIRIEK